jgi:hypothetical protein
MRPCLRRSCCRRPFLMGQNDIRWPELLVKLISLGGEDEPPLSWEVPCERWVTKVDSQASKPTRQNGSALPAQSSETGAALSTLTRSCACISAAVSTAGITRCYRIPNSGSPPRIRPSRRHAVAPTIWAKRGTRPAEKLRQRIGRRKGAVRTDETLFSSHLPFCRFLPRKIQVSASPAPNAN